MSLNSEECFMIAMNKYTQFMSVYENVHIVHLLMELNSVKQSTGHKIE